MTDHSNESIQQGQPTASEPEGSNPFSKLVNGEFGLPITFWAYGILSGPIWAVGLAALSPEPGSALSQTVYFLMASYYIAVYAGIWSASGKYTGAKVWAVLARFSVLLVVVPAAILAAKLIFK